jgi:hypothetical protein
MSAGTRVGGVILCLWALLAPSARAADEEAIHKAVEAGVAYLKATGQQPNGWQYKTGRQSTPLVALTLLECDVPGDDPAVQKAAALIRESSLTETFTYSLALDILFFDRLGDPQDEPLIEALTRRLLKGQTLAGGWGYSCPIDLHEIRGLRTKIKGQEAKEDPKDPGQAARAANAARAGQQGFGPVPQPLGPPPPTPLVNPDEPMRPEGDNSNTQFATIALWVARRHKLPVDKALTAVERRYRRSQNADGGWGYITYSRPIAMPASSSTVSMTCAGLLGLAAGHGVAGEAKSSTEHGSSASRKHANSPPRDPSRDPNIHAGLLFLGAAMSGPYSTAQRFRGMFPTPPGIPPAAAARLDDAQKRLQNMPGQNNDADYYGLWSMERVAMALGLKTINKINWYDWGADIIVTRQNATGSWVGGYSSGGVDTCFALLFLVRSNLAPDLTSRLKGRVLDPAEVKLRAGGIGGQGLIGRDEPDVPPPGPKMTKKDPLAPGNIPDLRDPDTTTPVSPRKQAEPHGAESPGAEAEAARLGTQLVKAPAEKKEAVLDRLREKKGLAYTQALASAIPHLKGEAKNKARDALAERLARMTSSTLRDKFGDEDLEIRRAAAVAGYMKDDKSFVPDLIKLLGDDEPPVARAAHAALKKLTGEDFGPSVDASRAERTQAIADWKAWWAKQKGN